MTTEESIKTSKRTGAADGKISVKNRPSTGSGRIAGQGTRKDTATTLLFKSGNENFAEVFNRTVFMDAPVSADDLVDEDIKETAFLKVAREYGGTSLVQYRDVVKAVKDGRMLVILGVENQSEINYQMPFRVLEVDFVNYARQIQMIEEKHNGEWRDEDGGRHVPAGVSDGEYMSRFLKTDKILPCVTLVLYWGEKPWDGPRRLSDMFSDSPWASLAWDMEMNILDVHQMEEEEICAYTSELRTVFGFVKYARDKDKLKEFIDNNTEYFSDVSGTALNVINELTHSPELQRIKSYKYRTQEGGFDMCLGIQEMIRDSREEGREEGREKGREEGREAGRNEGRSEGLNQGIRGAVELLREAGLCDQTIVEKIMAKYSLGLDAAEGYVWGKGNS